MEKIKKTSLKNSDYIPPNEYCIWLWYVYCFVKNNINVLMNRKTPNT